jgi:hypothetical protein
MQDDDGLIAQYLERDPRAHKRLRDVALEEIWAAGGSHIPDFSTLPKELWGMIAARCEVSGKMLTTLMLLNKERISAAVWANFRFPAKWNYFRFARFLLKAQSYRNNPGFNRRFYKLFGVESVVDFLQPVERYATIRLADLIWESGQRELKHNALACRVMEALSGANALLICISKILSLYVPLEHCQTLCVMFGKLGCTVDWANNFDYFEQQLIENTLSPLPVIPPELSAITAIFTNVDIALGYYNAYRRHAWKDYGVRLAKIELKDD